MGNPLKKCSSCGNYGCIESELSINGMISSFPEIDQTMPLMERWNTSVEKIMISNEKTDAVVRNLGSLFGKLSSILINLFDPEVFFISGYITDIFERLEPCFMDELSCRCDIALSKGLQIIVDSKSTKHVNVYTGLCDIMFNLWDPLNSEHTN